MTKKRKNILENIKNAEIRVKQALLLKEIAKLKDILKEILEKQEYCKLVLQELGVKKSDIKKILSFLNSLEDVRLDRIDIERLKKEIKTRLSQEKREINKKIFEELSNRIEKGLDCSNLSDLTSEGYGLYWNSPGTWTLSTSNDTITFHA